MENNIVIKKMKKRNKINLIAMFIALIVAIAIFYIVGMKENELPEPIDVHNIIAGYTNQEEVYAKIDIQYLTDSFARYGEGNDNDTLYYFATDKAGYGYIVSLTNETFKKLEEINEYTYSNESDKIPEPITITGVTKSIPNELKNIAIEMYADVYNEELTQENFEEYYGSIYLKEGEDPTDTELLVLIAILALVFFIIFLAIYFITKIKIKTGMKKIKSREDFEKIHEELEMNEKDEFLKIGTVLTKNYIIDASFGLKAIKYEEINWIYEHKFKTYGITTKKSLIIFTRDNKKHEIAVTDSIGKKAKEEFNMIFNKIIEKAPNALVGYTKENIDAIKGKRLI